MNNRVCIIKRSSSTAPKRIAIEIKGLSWVYFITFCQILAMKLNICKVITAMDINDKTIASLQPNVSPERYNLKLQANKVYFQNCSAQQYFKRPYRNPVQSSSILAIRTFCCICCVIVIFLHRFKRLFVIFHRIWLSFPVPKLGKNPWHSSFNTKNQMQTTKPALWLRKKSTWITDIKIANVSAVDLSTHNARTLNAACMFKTLIYGLLRYKMRNEQRLF